MFDISCLCPDENFFKLIDWKIRWSINVERSRQFLKYNFNNATYLYIFCCYEGSLPYNFFLQTSLLCLFIIKKKLRRFSFYTCIIICDQFLKKIFPTSWVVFKVCFFKKEIVKIEMFSLKGIPESLTFLCCFCV